jgi:hypothetical protein
MKVSILLSLAAVSVVGSSMEMPPLNNRTCPTAWMVPTNGGCTCESSLYGKIVCDDCKGLSTITNCFCMTTGETNDTTGETEALVGPCLYTCTLFNHTYNRKMEYNQTIEAINNDTCGPYRRTGRLCGKCIQNYGLPVYSFRLSCVLCTHYKHNWLKYIAAAYVPLTLFYIFIIVFRISATSGWLNGYIFLTQMTTIRRMALLMSNNAVIEQGKYHLVDKWILTVPSIWNLDFLRSVYPPFCLHPDLSALPVLMLDYIVAIYPMLLIALTYLLVKLYDRFQLVSWLCRPFYRCFHTFKREWDINSSLIRAFTTFYLLSYVKVITVTADIVAPVAFQNGRGNFTEHFFFYDASIPYLGEQHRPYAISAVVFATVYNILPFLLLCMYPWGLFHRALNKTGCRCHTLHAFMDAMLGAYSHKPRERRYFGALFLFIRVLHVAAITVLHTYTYFSFASYIMIMTIILVATLQPYKNKWHNRVDIILFSAAAHAYLMIVFSQEGFSADPNKHGMRRRLYKYSTFAVLAILPIYGIPVLARHILPLRFIRRRLESAYVKFSLMLKESNSELSAVPERMDHSESNPLLTPINERH